MVLLDGGKKKKKGVFGSYRVIFICFARKGRPKKWPQNKYKRLDFILRLQKNKKIRIKKAKGYSAGFLPENACIYGEIGKK